MDPKLPDELMSDQTQAETHTERDAAHSNKFGGDRQRGAVGWAFLWLIGIPVPILLLLFFVRGCT